MVDRYQQGQLASSQTGLPREDHSMSKAAALIAQAADRSREQAMQTAASDFARAGALFNQAGYQAQALVVGLGKNKGAAEEERRRMQVALAQIDEDDAAESNFNAYREKYKADPQKAVEAFKADIPNMREAFRQRHGSDPIALRILMPIHHRLERETAGRLEAWAQKTGNKNLESRLQLLPEELSDKVANLQGSISDQFQGFQNILKSSAGIYQAMYENAQDQGTRDEIEYKRRRLEGTLAKTFYDHILGQTPDGEEGIQYLNNIGDVISNARILGLPMTADDQKQAVEHLRSVKRNLAQDTLNSIAIDGSLRIFEANKIKADIFDAASAGDTKRIGSLALKVDGQLKQLDQRIMEISKEPDSDIKKAKLAELRKEQNTYITELGMGLNEQRTIQRMQWAIEGMARAQASTQRSLVNFARSTERYNAWLADRAISQEQKAERKAIAEAFDKRLSSFNSDWSRVEKGLRETYSLPAGEKQQKAIKDLADSAIPQLNAALKSGTITHTSYKSYLDSLKRRMEEASAYKTSQPANLFGFQWGGGETQRLKKTEADKAQERARTQFGEMIKRHGSQFDDLDTGYKMLGTLTIDKREKAVLTQYLSENMPRVLNSKKYQALPAPKRQQELARLIRNVVQTYRQGGLK